MKFYFVLGPESSGTRMFCDAILSSNDFGVGGIRKINQYEYKSVWNTEDSIFNSLIKNKPEKALFTRSLPRGSYPNKQFVVLEDIYNNVINAGYSFIPIVMVRKFEYLVKSQIARGHVRNEQEALANIRQAYKYIDTVFNNLNISEINVKYESLVNNESYRKKIFKSLNLNYPDFVFIDMNRKYDK